MLDQMSGGCGMQTIVAGEWGGGPRHTILHCFDLSYLFSSIYFLLCSYYFTSKNLPKPLLNSPERPLKLPSKIP